MDEPYRSWEDLKKAKENWDVWSRAASFPHKDDVVAFGSAPAIQAWSYRDYLYPVTMLGLIYACARIWHILAEVL